MAEGRLRRNSRPTSKPASMRTVVPRGTLQREPPLTIDKKELAQMVAQATVDALKRETAKRAKRAKAARDKLKKGRSAPGNAATLARSVATQAAATRQRAHIAELAMRLERESDPLEKSQLSQQLTYERLRLAHALGRI